MCEYRIKKRLKMFRFQSWPSLVVQFIVKRIEHTVVKKC